MPLITEKEFFKMLSEDTQEALRIMTDSPNDPLWKSTDHLLEQIEKTKQLPDRWKLLIEYSGILDVMKQTNQPYEVAESYFTKYKGVNEAVKNLQECLKENRDPMNSLYVQKKIQRLQSKILDNVSQSKPIEISIDPSDPLIQELKGGHASDAMAYALKEMHPRVSMLDGSTTSMSTSKEITRKIGYSSIKHMFYYRECSHWKISKWDYDTLKPELRKQCEPTYTTVELREFIQSRIDILDEKGKQIIIDRIRFVLTNNPMDSVYADIWGNILLSNLSILY